MRKIYLVFLSSGLNSGEAVKRRGDVGVSISLCVAAADALDPASW